MVAKWAKGLPQNKLEVHQGSPYENILYVKNSIVQNQNVKKNSF